MKKVLTALCLLLVAASTVDATEVINGCYKRINGQFRILLPGTSCLPSEVAVSFRSATDTTGLNPEMYDANGQYLGLAQVMRTDHDGALR